jgi:hypothetical protein
MVAAAVVAIGAVQAAVTQNQTQWLAVAVDLDIYIQHLLLPEH